MPFLLMWDWAAVAGTRDRQAGCIGCWWNRYWDCGASSSRLALRLPPEWANFELVYRFGAARYVIRVQHSQSADWLLVQDGVRLAGLQITLEDQPRTHTLDLYVPRTSERSG